MNYDICMTLEDALYYASSFDGRAYIFRVKGGFDWCINSHGDLDYFVILGK